MGYGMGEGWIGEEWTRRTDDGDRTGNDGAVRGDGREVAGITQWLQRFDSERESSWAVSLDINPEVKSLAACHVKDAAVRQKMNVLADSACRLRKRVEGWERESEFVFGVKVAVDLLPGLRSHKRTNRVRPIQHRQNLLNVQPIERAGWRQRTLFVANVQRAVVEPDIGLDGDGADGEGLVEGDLLMLSVHVIDH